MDSSTEVKQPSAIQTYVLAAICLVLGIALGYLLHAPASTPANAPGVPAQQAAAPAGMNGNMPTPDQMQHMVDKAVEPMMTALQKDPNNADLLAQAASVYFKAQQFDKSAEYYEKAMKAKPTAEGYVSLGNAYHYAGNDDKAVENLNAALKIDPKSANALYNLGMIEWRVKNDPNAAIDAWQRLVKANPKHPQRAKVEEMIAKAKKHIGMSADAKTTKPSM